MDLILKETEVSTTPGIITVLFVYDISIGGGLVLQALEPLSREKMWLKRIDFPTVTRHLTVDTSGEKEGVESMRNALDNACGEMLTDFFTKAMPQISNYFSADEMRRLKEQSLEIREKKRY